MNMNPYLITAAVGYLLGSIPFGYLLVRIFKGEDVRSSGSGNIGATNVARKSPGLGVATLLLDAAKGLAAVLLARALFSGPHQQLIMTTAAFFAVLGHLFPVWLKFRGGKGVATSLRIFYLAHPEIHFVHGGPVFAHRRRLPLRLARVGRGGGGFSAAGVGPPRIRGSRQLIFIALVSALVIWRHRRNIGRLAAGTETKLGSKLSQGQS